MSDVNRPCESRRRVPSDRDCPASNRPRFAVKLGEHLTGFNRWLSISLGLFFVGLAVLGAVLPILPSTPFLILASSCFVRSSPSLQSWLMRMPVWGPVLRDWDTHHAVRPHAKRVAFVVILFSAAASAIVGQFSGSLTMLLFGFVLIGVIAVWRLPVIPRDRQPAYEIADVNDARLAQKTLV